MTDLRKLMLEERERRNYSQATVRAYVAAVEDFARYFHCRPDQLGPDHIRQYQAYLFRERKLTANSVTQRLGAGGVLLPLCFRLLADSGRIEAQTRSEEKVDSSPRPLWICPQCGGPMVLTGRLSPIELRLRSPPVSTEQRA